MKIQSGAPVEPASTVYFTPYAGNRIIAIYNISQGRWELVTMSHSDPRIIEHSPASRRPKIGCYAIYILVMLALLILAIYIYRMSGSVFFLDG